MITEFADSVTGAPIHINPEFVVAMRPEPEDPLHVTVVKLNDGEVLHIRGDHDEVARKLSEAATH
jgi:hypothetical protein